jgi:hypothetical protein
LTDSVFVMLGFEAGKMPGRMDMLKLMMDKEFRDAAQKVGWPVTFGNGRLGLTWYSQLNEEMKEAGVEFNPEVGRLWSFYGIAY